MTFNDAGDIVRENYQITEKERGTFMEVRRMPHIQLPENLGINYAVLPGDPARVDRAARWLEESRPLAFNREYKSVSGKFKGVPVLIMSTGMGGPSTAIAVEELHKIGVKAAVRVGSCGALQPGFRPGELVLVTGAVRDEGTTLGYAPLSYPALPDVDLLCACRDSAERLGFPWHMGIARSHDCLYRDENPEIYEQWSKKGVAASDMETASLFVTGSIRGMRTASVLNVVSAWGGQVSQDIGSYAAGQEKLLKGEEREILTALTALVQLDHMMRT